MNAQPLPAVAFVADQPRAARPSQEISWPQIIVTAPQMAATMARYLDQLAVSARPSTVVAVDLTLRQFAGCVTAVAKRAGVGHVHPHQLLHTLATQAINRGMTSKQSPRSSATAP